MRRKLKVLFSFLLSAVFRITTGLRRNLRRIQSHALLSSRLTTPLDVSIVVMGPPEVHGTGKVRFGCDALIYPGLYLETDEVGSIEIGDRVVLSRGVHIVARAGITIGHGTMIGEYSSIRDANHAHVPGVKIREAGHESRPIWIGAEVWSNSSRGSHNWQWSNRWRQRRGHARCPTGSNRRRRTRPGNKPSR